MSSNERPAVTRVLRASVAPFLLLITPFVGYVQYQRHGFGNPEVLVVVLLIAAIGLVLGGAASLAPVIEITILTGLVVFYADIQLTTPGLKRLGMLFLILWPILWLLRTHAARIISLMTAAALAVSLLPSRSHAISSEPLAVGTAGVPTAASRGLPLMVHLVFDEHIGPEGLPAELVPAGYKEEFQSFFLERGFRLFGKAYSEYPVTAWSISQLLNLAPGEYVSDLRGPGAAEGTYRLKRNAYFDALLRLGYSIRVHEPDFIDVCPEGMRASCVIHPARSLRLLDRMDAQLQAKVAVVAGTFVGLSEAYERTRLQYGLVRRQLISKGVPLPRWSWERSTPAPVGSMPMFDAIAADLSKAQPGTFLYAHVLMPHYPYVYDADCRQRPMSEWLGRSDWTRGNVPRGLMNVPEGRADRYAMYFQQIICTRRKIDELINAIPPSLRQNATIILQGDHGSRISIMDPMIHVPASRLALSDYADHFSTLFAVRSASLDAGYDLRVTPITCLLRTLVESGFRSTDRLDSCTTTRKVYFHGNSIPEPHPLPDFWGAVHSSDNEARPARLFVNK